MSIIDKIKYKQYKQNIENNTGIGESEWAIQQQTKYKEGIIFANSCGQRKCPCRTWLQCSKYNSRAWADVHPENFNKELHSWYDIHFRIAYEHGENIGNG